MLDIVLSQNTLLFVFAILLAVIISGYLCYTKIEYKKPVAKKTPVKKASGKKTTTKKASTKKKSTKK